MDSGTILRIDGIDDGERLTEVRMVVNEDWLVPAKVTEKAEGIVDIFLDMFPEAKATFCCEKIEDRADILRDVRQTLEGLFENSPQLGARARLIIELALALRLLGHDISEEETITHGFISSKELAKGLELYDLYAEIKDIQEEDQ